MPRNKQFWRNYRPVGEPMSLKGKAISTIVQNVGSFKRQLKRKLAPPTREEVLQKVIEETCYVLSPFPEKRIRFEEIWTELPYLLSSRTKDFQTRWLFNMLTDPQSHQEIFQELMSHLSTNACNLASLNLEGAISVHIRQEECITLRNFENLSELDISDVAVQLSTFLQLSLDCKQLKCIKGSNLEMDSQLVPESMHADYVNRKIDARELHQRQLGLELNKELPSKAYPKCDRVCHLFLKPRTKSELGFFDKISLVATHIDIHCYLLEKEDELEEFPVSMPMVRSAVIKCNKRFSNVLRRFLAKNGRNLVKLVIRCLLETAPKTCMKEIFEWCPDLEILHLDRTFVCGKDDYLAPRLRRFFWHFFARDGARVPISFTSILLSPHLECLTVFTEESDDGYFQSNIVERIAKREILTKLRNIYIDELFNHACIFSCQFEDLIESEDEVGDFEFKNEDGDIEFKDEDQSEDEEGLNDTSNSDVITFPTRLTEFENALLTARKKIQN